MHIETLQFENDSTIPLTSSQRTSPTTPVTANMLKTADPIIVPTPISPSVIKEP